MNKVLILGAWQTQFGELWQKSLDDLIREASLKAIKDSGLSKKQIEIVFLGNKLAGNLSGQNHLSALFAQILNMDVPIIRVEAACASGGVAIRQGCLAINSGEYKTALVVGAEKMTDMDLAEVSSGLMTAAGQEEQDSGLSFVGLYALMAKTYLSRFKAKQEDLAYPALKNHFHASLNPKAHFPFQISLRQVMESSLIASPLRMLECSPISDGAAAVVLADPKKFKKRGRKVFISASSQASQSLVLSKRKDLTEIEATQKAACQAYKQAGIKPQELSLLEVHDCFSIAEIMALEDLGLFDKGEGYVRVKNGEVRLGGKRPVNVSGGLKACGHPVGATGVKQVVEIFDQLKQRGGQKQVKDSCLGLTHNVGGTGGTAVVHILQL